jgi:hypothetical protein
MLFAIFTKYVKVTATHSRDFFPGHRSCTHDAAPAMPCKLLNGFVRFFAGAALAGTGLFQSKPDGVICTDVL